MSGYLYQGLYFFVTLIAIVNPISSAAAFATLTGTDSPKEQERIARRAAIVAAVTLIAFAFAGEALLDALGVEIGAFKIAGGLLLLKVGFDMVFAERTHRQVADDAKTDAPPTPDPSVFPLAIPLITGPGALTASVALLHPTEGRQSNALIFVVVALVVIAITYVSMLGAEKLTKRFGQTGIDAVGRVVGIVVAAIAVQMIVNGVSSLTHVKL